MLLVARALYLFAPLLGSAVLSAVVHRYDLVSFLARPMDGGATWRGKRVFGDGKTWRGLAIAVVGSVATVFVQKHAASSPLDHLSLVDYDAANAWLLGSAFGVGAVAGELPNSFVKRRLGIARGGTARGRLARRVFWTWDQIDTVTLTWLFLLPWIRPTAPLVLVTFALTLAIHPAVALAGFLLGARATAR